MYYWELRSRKGQYFDNPTPWKKYEIAGEYGTILSSLRFMTGSGNLEKWEIERFVDEYGNVMRLKGDFQYEEFVVCSEAIQTVLMGFFLAEEQHSNWIKEGF